MGMFDDIIVPKSYLKGLLTKEQEKLLKVSNRYGGSVKGVEFQTKSLENSLLVYKIHKQKLYSNNKTFWNCEPPATEQRTEDTPKKYPYEKGAWDKVTHDGLVNFYDSIESENGDRYWVEFNFLFKNGVIDKKELVKFEVEMSAGEVLEQQHEFAERQAKAEVYRNTLKYRVCFKLHKILQSICSWVGRQLTMPSPENIKVDRERANKRTKPSFWKDF